MPDKFNMQSPPFNRLTAEQQHQLRSALDVAYFRQRDVLIDAQHPVTHLHILIKGTVEERSPDGKEVFAHYANDDLFDVRAMFEELSKHQYMALEDTLSYLLPKSIFLQLYEQNGEFAAYFDNNLAKRQELIEAAAQQKNIAEFILTKVDRSIYHPPFILSPEQPIHSVTQQLKERGIDAALVELHPSDPRLAHNHAHPYAIVTRTNMLHAVMLEGRPLDTPVGEIATFPVLHVDEGDFLFNAMVMMTRQRIKRVMVCLGNQAVGLLSLIQILSAFSTHSHVLTLAIARAASIDELALAANKQRELVESLMSRGVRTRFVMELIAAVNEQIIEKAFELVVPPALHDQCCLVVLGSEGRGEQILKTDQDNALIIQDGLEWHQCQPIMETLTHTLLQLGYPLCPGKVMDIAIFADAHAVAGNRALLAPVKAHLQHLMAGQELILAEFTRPALNFSVPLTLFGNVKSSKQGIDIKQGGIFPIVHGVRALSLEHAIDANNTFDRIEALVKKRVLEQETGDNLSEAFKLFLKLRLAQQLGNQHSTNQLDFKQLDRTERDLLRHSLHVVKKFKQNLSSGSVITIKFAIEVADELVITPLLARETQRFSLSTAV